MKTTITALRSKAPVGPNQIIWVCQLTLTLKGVALKCAENPSIHEQVYSVNAQNYSSNQLTIIYREGETVNTLIWQMKPTAQHVVDYSSGRRPTTPKAYNNETWMNVPKPERHAWRLKAGRLLLSFPSLIHTEHIFGQIYISPSPINYRIYWSRVFNTFNIWTI